MARLAVTNDRYPLTRPLHKDRVRPLTLTSALAAGTLVAISWYLSGGSD